MSELFKTFGEPSFRDGERRVVTRLLDGQPKVIATGGGAFIDDDTRALILRKAIAIWLDTDINVLTERTARRPGQRPLLLDKRSA